MIYLKLLVLFFMFISQFSYAYWNCGTAFSECATMSSYCGPNGYGVCTCYRHSESMVYMRIGSNLMPFGCRQEPLRCSLPEEKVGTMPNGDDKCSCPSSTPLSGSYTSKQIAEKGYVGASNMGDTPPPPSPGTYDDSPAPKSCISDTRCAEGFDFLAGTDGSQFSCTAKPIECGTGYSPNPNYNPIESSSLKCLQDIVCPEGTSKIAAIETQPGLNFFGTMPNPRFPNRTGYCNDNHCCVGVNPRPLPTGEKYCAQGSAIGFTDGTDSFADDSQSGGCTCPSNATQKSQGQYQQALQQWSGASFFNKNQSLSPLVCDYTKPPSDGSGQNDPDLPTDSVWSGKYDACAKFKDKGHVYDLCIGMDQSMRDWMDNNVDCGAKQGLECISDKMKDVFKKCHVVDGVVTCEQTYVPPEGVELPDPVIEKSDSHGFPQHAIDEMFNTDGMDFKSPASKNPNDLKPPKEEEEEDDEDDETSPALRNHSKFDQVWNGKFLLEQRARYNEIFQTFLKVTDKFKVPSIGGSLPCYTFDYKLADTALKKICLFEQPYLSILDFLALCIGFLTYLFPVIIFVRN